MLVVSEVTLYVRALNKGGGETVLSTMRSVGKGSFNGVEKHVPLTIDNHIVFIRDFGSSNGADSSAAEVINNC